MINAQNKGRIFIINDNVKISLKYLVIENGKSDSGGGIVSNGNLTSYKCKFQNNKAGNGGAIFTNPSRNTLNLRNCTFTKNVASSTGGAIFNNMISTITNCTFANNTASSGGAIFNFGSLNVTQSTFQYNTANYHDPMFARGGAVFAASGTTYVNFCRIIENNPNTSQIYSAAFVDPTVVTDLNLNWWGSNDNPSTKIQSPYAVTWLVLKIYKTPNIIAYGSSSSIKASFQYDNLNNYHDPKMGHIPDGETVYFTGDGSFSQYIPKLVNGSVTTVFTPNALGLSRIWTIFDNILYANNVKIYPALKVSSITPKNNTANITPPSVIRIIFTQPLKAGNMNIVLINSLGTHISFVTKIDGNILTITPISQLTTGKYALIMHTGCLKSPDGIPLALYVTSFTTDSTPPKVSTTIPNNLKTGVKRSGIITVKFSENIKYSTYYYKITIKNLSTGKTTPFTRSISGKILYLETTKSRSAHTWYLVTIPARAVKDYAGNDLKAKYTFKFKTCI